MTSKAALCYCLLTGKVVNIGNIHSLTGFTNAAREIGRSVERVAGEGVGCTGFGVKVTRTKREGKNRFGVYCTWVDYRLEWSRNNINNLRKIAKYVSQQIGSPKTSQQQTMINNLKPLLK